MTLSSDPMIDLSLRFLLALVFAGAAVSKLQNRDEFHGVVRNFRLLPRAVDGAFAFVLPWVELAIAVALVTGVGLVITSVAAAVLLVMFAVAVAINIVRGRTEIDCGCFRHGLRQRLSWALVARNGVLALAALWISTQPIWSRGFGAYDIVIGALVASSVLVIYMCATELAAIRRLPIRGRSLANEGWPR